jgi:hypothetical protein
MEGDKVKKKLHGSILKGSKIRIEEAKPAKKRKVDDEEVAEEVEQTKKPKKPKKSKPEDNVIEGIELPDGRKVKRGWTEPETRRKSKKDSKDKKDKKARKAEKSKYTKEPEMLFKTVLTPTAATENASSKSSKKEKRKSKKDREVVVHEFEKTKKHASFLNASKNESTTKPASEFVEGKGWVDEDGNVVEEAHTRRIRDTISHKDLADDDDSTSRKERKAKKGKSKSTSSAVDDSHPPTTSNRLTAPTIEPTIESSPNPQPPNTSISPPPPSTSSLAPAKATSSTQPTLTTPPKTPHPLETIYKRPTNRPTSIDLPTAFSFFGANNDNNSDDDEIKDGEVEDDEEGLKRKSWARYARSGAPTPDTAAASRRFSFSRGIIDGDDDDEDSDAPKASSMKKRKGLGRVDEEDAEEGGDAGEGATATGEDGDEGEREESAFAKWFWENRGDNNRKWKKMRREGMKEKRNRENRRIGRRIV